jgi:hypothetical protein
VILQNCIGDVIQWTHGSYNLVRSQFFEGHDKRHSQTNPLYSIDLTLLKEYS